MPFSWACSSRRASILHLQTKERHEKGKEYRDAVHGLICNFQVVSWFEERRKVHRRYRSDVQRLPSVSASTPGWDLDEHRSAHSILLNLQQLREDVRCLLRHLQPRAMIRNQRILWEPWTWKTRIASRDPKTTRKEVSSMQPFRENFTRGVAQDYYPYHWAYEQYVRDSGLDARCITLVPRMWLKTTLVDDA